MATYMNNTTERRKSCNTCLKKDIDNIKLCTGCRQVGYCSKDCQRKDWLAGHQVSCKKYAAEKENISKACTLCGKTSSNMRACTRCWKSCYCDVSCQISDLKRHRKTCHSGRAPPNPPSKTLRSSYDCSLFAPVLGCTQSELEDKLITAKRPTVELYGKVKARVRQLYPSHSLIQKFSKVPKEYEVRDARKVVLLVLIARNHPYPGRTCVYLAVSIQCYHHEIVNVCILP